MKTILLYLLQMALCSGVLYGYYILFLKNKKQHQFNRVYLLSSFLLSLLVPFIKIPLYISLNNDSSMGLQALVKYNELVLPEVVVSSTNNGMPFWSQLLLVVYAAIAVWLIFKISYGILKLIQQRFVQKTQRSNDILMIETSDKSAPYSFFNWLYWNPDLDVNSANGKKIMQHEYYHIQQLHSIDILLAELFTALAWINPFFWFIKNELKAVHEFSADAFASRDSDELEYATLLVSEAINQKRKILVNPFLNNQLKRRIQMLTTNSKHNPLMKWMAIPLILIVAGLSIISCQSTDEKKSTSSTTDSSTTQPSSSATGSDTMTITEVPTDPIPPPPIVNNNPTGTIKEIPKSLKYIPRWIKTRDSQVTG